MNRNVGIEAIRGAAGGIVSAESQRNLQIGDEYCRKRQPRLAVPYFEKALQDENNLDVYVSIAFIAPNKAVSVQRLEDGVRQGQAVMQRVLGPDAFDDDGPHVGHYWQILETRSYMRVLQALVRLSFEDGQYEKSATTMIEMLRLSPGDNMGQRMWLGSVLIRNKRYGDAISFARTWITNEQGDGTPPPRGGCVFERPLQEPYSAEREAKMSDGFATSCFFYTGAYASFRLWGDCEISRQYLRIAARLNPFILTRIVGKVTRPTQLNNQARAPNGSEDAHDYAWLTQDLWEEPDVWNWANAQHEAIDSVLNTCSRPNCGNVETSVREFKRCSACKQVRYCSPTCQTDHWSLHKPACRQHKELQKASKLFNAGKVVPESPMLMFASDTAYGHGTHTISSDGSVLPVFRG